MTSSSRDHAPHTCAVTSGQSQMAQFADKIVAHLDKVQKRELQKDTGHGYRSAREIAQAVGLPKAECRSLLEQLAADSRIRREEFSNALSWRSITPLPWEPGGTLALERAREAELWAGELTLIVQAVWTDGVHTLSRDVKAYPAGLRERAEANVRLENSQSHARREDDRCHGSHLRAGYRAPPTYRIVSLLPAETAKSEGK